MLVALVSEFGIPGFLKRETWNSKANHVLYGCFNWMIQNPYMGNGCFTKHPKKNWLFGVPGKYCIILIILEK